MLNTSDEWHGTSSLYAVRIAIELGSAEKIILAGCPMDQSGHYYDREDLGLYLETYRKGWLSAYPRIKDIVRSYSGWTRELLGEPTEEWLRG